MFNFHSNRECNNLLTLRDSVLFFYTIPQLNDNSLNQAKCKCNKNATKCKSKMPCYFLIALVFVRFFFIIEIDINLTEYVVLKHFLHNFIRWPVTRI